MEIQRFLPTPPEKGPPLPRGLKIEWPWEREASQAGQRGEATYVRCKDCGYVWAWKVSPNWCPKCQSGSIETVEWNSNLAQWQPARIWRSEK